MRVNILIIVLWLALAPPAYGQSADCSADASPALQQQIDAWLTAGGTLHIPAGCYRLSHTLRFAHADGSPVFGNIEGDGPEVTRFVADAGIGQALRFEDWWLGSMSGFSVQGSRNGVTNPDNTGDAGIVFAARHQDLGTCCGTVENVTSSGFARCWLMGEDAPPFPAAAEFVLTNVGGNYCGDGFSFASYNTLDFVFQKAGFTNTGTAFHTIFGGPGQLTFVGGGSTNNATELNTRGDCTTVYMTEYRAEQTTSIPVLAGGCPGQKLTIINSQLSARSDYVPVSIQLDNGDTQVALIGNTLIGQVQMVQGTQTVYAYGNTILTQNGLPPFGFSDPNCCGTMRLYTAGNRNAQSVAGSWPTDWWPDNLQGMWLFPPNSDASHQNPTPTPIPATTATAAPTAQPTALPPTRTPIPTTATPIPLTATPGASPTTCSQDVSVTAAKSGETADSVSVDLHLDIPVCQ